MIHLSVRFVLIQNYNILCFEWKCKLTFDRHFEGNCREYNLRFHCDCIWLIHWSILCNAFSSTLLLFLKTVGSMWHSSRKLMSSALWPWIAKSQREGVNSSPCICKHLKIWIDPKKTAYSINEIPFMFSYSFWFLIRNAFVS